MKHKKNKPVQFQARIISFIERLLKHYNEESHIIISHIYGETVNIMFEQTIFSVRTSIVLRK